MTENRLQLTPLISRFAGAASRTVGARHIADDVCRSDMIPAPPGVKMGQAYTTGCGGESKFALPVGVAGKDEPFKTSKPCVVCVVDDMAYAFPKYGGDEGV
jgi:hypothetical protein